MHQISFGNVLKEARLAKGWDLASVSRELRIRQDIIVAIENSDFRRMPSRGYARNMIIAYSRLLGLNAQDVSRMYLDQEYAFQVEQAHQNVSETIRMHDTGSDSRSSNTSSFGRVGSSGSRTRSSRPIDDRNQYDGSSNGFGRAVYSQNPDVYPTLQGGQPSTHKARRSAMGEGKYGNMYSAPRNIPNPHRNRNIIIVVVAVLVVVVALVFALNMSHQTQTQANIPVTGAQSVGTTSQEAAEKQQDASQEQQQTTTVETAPTEFTLKYTVDKGSSSYIEVYVDDAVKESGTVSGAAEKSYTSSSKIRFVATETKGVTVYINDEAQQLETNKSGIVNTTYNFSDILEQWYTNHPNAKRDSSAATTSSTSSGSTSSTSSTSSSSSSTSSKSSSKTQQ